MLYRFDGQTAEAWVNPSSYWHSDHLETLSLSGAIQTVPAAHLKAVCFAANSAKPDLFSRDNLFRGRPKLPGIWARFTFRDGDRLDGILPHNLLEWPPFGFWIIPPRTSATRQSVVVPKSALSTTEILGVIGVSVVVPRKVRPAEESDQLTMFE